MPTFHHTLPRNKSFEFRKFEWDLVTQAPEGKSATPISWVGVLQVIERKKVDSVKPKIRRYATIELPAEGTQRKFQLTKPKGKFDAGEVHFVCLASYFDECTCRGYLSGGICVHIQCMRIMHTKGVLPAPHKRPSAPGVATAPNPGQPSTGQGQAF